MKRKLIALVIAWAVLLSACAGTAMAASEYQMLAWNEKIDESLTNGYVTTMEFTPVVELWHYSGGYWGSNWFKQKYNDGEMKKFFIPITDKDEESTQYDTKGVTIEFNAPLPDEVRDYVGFWGDESVIVQINNLKDKNIYYNPDDPTDPNNPQFRIQDGMLHFKAIPRFYINNDQYDNYVDGLDNKIPIPASEYGINVYSMFAKGGSTHYGRAEGTFFDEPGKIQYTQIADSGGNLKVDEEHPNTAINVIDDTGSGAVQEYNSANIRIGDGTFRNAGAVGIYYEYPLEIIFYKNAAMNINTNVTRRYIDASTNTLLYEDNVQGDTLFGDSDSTKLSIHIIDWDGYTYQSWYSALEDGTVDAEGDGRDAEITLTSVNHNKILNIEYMPGEPGGDIHGGDRPSGDNPPDDTTTGGNEGGTQPDVPPLSGCSDRIKWQEQETHKVLTGYTSNGSPIYKNCTDTYTYSAKLDIKDISVSPQTLKSGYGFGVDVTAEVRVYFEDGTSSYGCNNVDWNRKPTKKVTMPASAEVQLGYTTSNALGTQGNIVKLEKQSESKDGDKTILTYRAPVNPMSVLGERIILTDIYLTGTKDRPVTHEFNVLVSGGGVNGMEFCQSAKSSFTINGDMYEDDKTTD